MRLICGLLAVFLTATAMADEHKYLKAFPEADEGRRRFVILLPEKDREEESRFRVEILVGKEMETDGVNQLRMAGKIRAKPLEGWGFTYYEVEQFGPVASTLIGVPPGTPKSDAFVSIPSVTIAYNSRIPLVVYVPDGGQVRYRIWQASDVVEKADEG